MLEFAIVDADVWGFSIPRMLGIDRAPVVIDDMIAIRPRMFVTLGYDHRLVVSRKLYDRAVGTAMSHSIAKLAPGPGAHLHPLDVEALGVERMAACTGRPISR